jgi:lactate dehydrogenase-like 2-hydroxyacid dehydrogenase
VIERARGANVLLTNKTPITRETIAALPDLKFISVLATGFNIVDTVAARERGISVSNVPVYGTDAVAQYVFAVLLGMIHQPALHDAAVRAGEWARREDFSFWLGSRTTSARPIRLIGRISAGRDWTNSSSNPMSLPCTARKQKATKGSSTQRSSPR